MGMPAANIIKEKYYHPMDIKKVYVKNHHNWYSGYTNYFIAEGNYIHLINISGYDSAAKGIASSLAKGDSIYIDNKSYYLSSGCRMFKQKVGNFTNILLVADTFINFNNNKYSKFFILKNGETLKAKVYEILKDNYTVPILEEWNLHELLLQKNLKQLSVYSANPNYPQKAYSLLLTETNLANLVTKNVKNGTFKIPGNDNDLEAVETLDDYLLKYGKQLAAKVIDKNKPLFVPGKDPYPEHINYLKRKPIGIQNDAIAAATKKLKKDNGVIINGEMGTGKTLIGSAIPYVAEKGKPTRVLIMCPGHLVQKWAREIKNTVPEATTHIIRSISDLKNMKKKPDGTEYYIISKDRAKLGYVLIPGVVYKKRTGGKTGPAYCPSCGRPQETYGSLINFDRPRKSNYKCIHCKDVLWQPDNTRLRRYPPAKYIAKYLKGYFDYLIADEVHELKGETAQGNSFGQLASACRKTIALTGTLAGGYASNLFYILYRMFPHKLSNNFRYDKIMDFICQYGFVERLYESYKKDAEINKSSFGIKGRLLSTKELPGISPMIFPHFLMDSCIYISLTDLQIKLPDYREEVVLVNMDKKLQKAYSEMQAALHRAVVECLKRGSKGLLSSYLINLLSYPDKPFNNENIREPDTGNLIYVPKELPKDALYPKEQKLLELIIEELAEGRKVFIYAQYTNKRDITKRLQELLTKNNIATAVLRSNTVKQEKREEWINKKIKEGIEVIIANPELVKTGLDLLAFPTIVFYQCGYSLYTLMQAARRSWRIGQQHDIRVYFFAYKNTMQENALQLMGKKYEASMVVNGKFTLDGLAQMVHDESMIVALAKALAGKINVKESAENIWKRLYNKPGKKHAFSNTSKLTKLEMPKQGQLNIFALYQYKTETKCKKEQKQKVAVGQLSLYDLL